MVYETFAQSNRTGLDGLFIYVVDTVPIFTPLLLFTLFVIATLASYFSQMRRTGRGDFPASFAVAGYMTAVIAIMMTFIDGFINSTTLVIVIIVAVIGTLWLFMSRDK